MTNEDFAELIKIHDSLSIKLNELVAKEANDGEFLKNLVEYRSSDSMNFMKLLTSVSTAMIVKEK